MSQKMTINNFCIETTRRCNMKCEHCLRGRAQGCNFNTEFLNPIFSQVEYIGDLVLTGGEPSLVPHVLEKICDKLEEYHVRIGRFYLATNAKHITKEFLNVLMRLYLICDETMEDGDELRMVEWSNDKFHDCQYLKGQKQLSVFKFAGPKYPKDSHVNFNSGLAQGRGKTYFGKEGRKGDVEQINVEEWSDNTTIEGTLYLNCKGKIVSGCDWSYHNQDKENSPYFICNANDFSIDALIAYENKVNAMRIAKPKKGKNKLILRKVG